MPKQEIVIVIEGGNIQSIDGIPKGITVKVLDFDANDHYRDAAHLESEGRTAYTDPDDGAVAEVLIWEGQDA